MKQLAIQTEKRRIEVLSSEVTSMVIRGLDEWLVQMGLDPIGAGWFSVERGGIIAGSTETCYYEISSHKTSASAFVVEVDMQIGYAILGDDC